MTRLRKAWHVNVRSLSADTALHYGPSASKVRYRAWLSISESFSELKLTEISVRRAPWRDVELPDRDPIADVLSPEERHCLMHAYGTDQGDPYKAGYREYFYTRRDDPPLVALTERGLMQPSAGEAGGGRT